MPVEISVSAEELSKKSLFLGVPMYGGNATGIFSKSVADLTQLCAQFGIRMQHHYLMNESLITRGRAYIADEFMRSDFTHLMFIDSDIGFNAPDVIAMLALSEENSEYDILCGPYPKKCISFEKLKMAVDKGFADENPNELEKFVGDYVFNPVGGKSEIVIHEPAEIAESGTGFMLIQRRVFEGFDKNYPFMKYRPDHVRSRNFDGSREIMMYFDCYIDRGYHPQEAYQLISDIAAATDKDYKKLKEQAKKMLKQEEKASKRYLSEDYQFCQSARRLGFKVWLCPWISLKHAGTYVFGGSLIDIARLGASATVNPEDVKKMREAEDKQLANK